MHFQITFASQATRNTIDPVKSGWSQSLDVPQRSYKISNPALEPTFETITH